MIEGSLAGPVPGRRLPLVEPYCLPFYEGAAIGVLRLQQCADTKRFQYYPRPRSKFTGGPVHWVDAAGSGAVYSFSIVRHHHAEPGFHALTPYVVAMIDLPEGVRITGNIVGCAVEEVAIGMAVTVEFACVDPATGLSLPFWRRADVVGAR